MSTLVGAIREIIRQELQALRVTELGLVEEVYPHSGASDTDNFGCDVKLKNSGLLLKRVPISTSHIGTAAIPNIGDLVLVAFYKADVNQPIVVGRLYNDKDRPPPNKPNEVIFHLPLNAQDNKAIRAAIRNIGDNDPPREVLVEMPPKITVRISDGTVRATAGKTEMKLDQQGSSGGEVTVVAGRTKITMNQDGDVKVESAGSMTLQASNDLTVKANANISIQAGATLSLEAGASAKLKANGQVTVQAAGAATVQAATVQLKGITSFGP
jgi:hypothetical protein